ncbi:MAG: glycosyltransferase family 2 protein [Muribaculum sp.]|nr:glycosyltransferase family 2 protein [Muribaculum sp.]
MARIAVLLTVHNRKEKTLRSLRLLYAQSLPEGCSIDVYLTDDGCTDGTRQAVAAEFPQTVIIDGDGILYWNRGMYRAWAAAASTCDYDFYMWLNDDTMLKPDAIKTLLNAATTCRDSVIVGAVCSSDQKPVVTYSGYAKGRLVVPDGRVHRCETFNGNIVLIPRAVYRVLGNLDYTYIHALGDVDYGWMATRAGMACYVTGDYVGVCDKNPEKPAWQRADVPLRQRWASLHSPLGYAPPAQMFHYNYKNFGLPTAVRVFVTNHIILLFPWIKRG